MPADYYLTEVEVIAEDKETWGRAARQAGTEAGFTSTPYRRFWKGGGILGGALRRRRHEG